MNTLTALPVHAQTYNQHLDTAWKPSKFNCNTGPLGTSCETTGVDGLTDTTASPRIEGASAGMVQVDGKLNMGGTLETNNGNSECEVARFNLDGTGDTGFGSWTAAAHKWALEPTDSRSWATVSTI